MWIFTIFSSSQILPREFHLVTFDQRRFWWIRLFAFFSLIVLLARILMAGTTSLCVCFFVLGLQVLIRRRARKYISVGFFVVIIENLHAPPGSVIFFFFLDSFLFFFQSFFFLFVFFFFQKRTEILGQTMCTIIATGQHQPMKELINGQCVSFN